jgi:hypothetical protein
LKEERLDQTLKSKVEGRKGEDERKTIQAASFASSALSLAALILYLCF